MQQDMMTVDAERHMPETTDRLEQEKEEDVLQTLVDDNIVEGVSIYDSEFDHGLGMYGDDYIQEYITGVSEHLAENIVRAYAAHDMKRYQEISPYFTEVYRFLFPVSDFEAGKAGNGDTYALVEHDVLDEGIDIIRKHYTLYEYRDDMIPVYDDIRHSDDSPTTAELRENSRLDDFFVRDLNREPDLPLDSGSFDAVTIAVSAQYLQYPETVFAEISRVLRPEGTLIVSFSNRCFPTKAIRARHEASMDERAALVKRYLRAAGGFGEPDLVRGRPGADPFYAVVARRTDEC